MLGRRPSIEASRTLTAEAHEEDQSRFGENRRSGLSFFNQAKCFLQ
jgi:hypothetical protein